MSLRKWLHAKFWHGGLTMRDDGDGRGPYQIEEYPWPRRWWRWLSKNASFIGICTLLSAIAALLAIINFFH